MGYSFKGVCHTTEQAAQVSFCQSLTASSLSASGQVQHSACIGVVPPNVNVRIDNGVTKTDAVILIPPLLSCEHDGGINLSFDYFVVALGFLALIAASKAVLNIFRGRSDVA